jgi:hypothetical protein
LDYQETILKTMRNTRYFHNVIRRVS